jgi:hypothetical protein
VIVSFVDIGGIVDHCFLNFLFIIKELDKTLTFWNPTFIRCLMALYPLKFMNGILVHCTI